MSLSTPSEQQIAQGHGELMVSQLLSSMGVDSFDALEPQARALITQIADELSRTGESVTLASLWEVDFIRTPVSPREFFTNEYFIGKHGAQLYPAWLDELDYVLDPTNRVFEWICSGAIGVGKTTVAVAAQCYKLHYMLCIRDLNEYYGLMKDSTIVIMFFGLTLGKTDMTLWNKFETFITASPYFKEQGFQKDGAGSKDDVKMVFPKNISFVGGSNSSHAMSLDVCGGVLDEQEFRKLKSQKTSYGEGNRAYDLYRAVRMRINSRFPTHCPGLLNNVSSAGASGGYMSQHIEATARDDRTHLSSFSRYEVTPERFRSGFFPVEVGNDIFPSKVLSTGEVARPGARIETVPNEFAEDFRRNVNEALMDISGISTNGQSKLINNRTDIYQCLDPHRRHPFTVESIPLGISNPLQIESFFLEDQLFAKREAGGLAAGMFEPLHNPEAPRFGHLDAAEVDDAFGLTIGHCAGFHSVESYDQGVGKVVVLKHPIIYIDLMLEIKAIEDDRIDFFKIQNFLLTLRKIYGMRFRRFTTDQYQSAQMRQAFIKEGIDSKILSVDKDDKAYRLLRDALAWGCVSMYKYQPAIDCLSDVEHDLEIRKVDHTLGAGKKDVSDCIASVTQQIIEEYPVDRQLSDETTSEMIEKTMTQAGISTEDNPYSQGPSQSSLWVTKGYSRARKSGDFFDDDEDE